ncbi:MAG: ATP-dependent DNA helicase RecG [Patescibacteria group bacterium]
MSHSLETPLSDLFRLTDIQKRALAKIGVQSAGDLLRYLPSRYTRASSIKAIKDISDGDTVAVEGKILSLEAKKTFQKRLRITEARIADQTGEITAVWFHQPYISKQLAKDDLVRLEGKVSDRKGSLFLSNPVYEKIGQLFLAESVTGSFLPVYPATRGASSRWIQFHILKTYEAIRGETFTDPVPKEILARYNLPNLQTAIRAAHWPKSEKENEGARKRLAFDEIFFIQLSRMQERMRLEETASLPIPPDKKALDAFMASLPFSFTKTQEKVFEAITSDISKKTPMARLLEGDVGSGKTVIAAGAAALATNAGFQATYMAPTEILARQHFDTFSKLLGTPFRKIGLLTSSEALVYPSKAFGGKPAHISKAQLFKWLESGEVTVLIGTHALLSEKVRFRHLAFIVVDEQHRFGVRQRMRLAKSKSRDHEYNPHFLSMTATPIPRTLALTVFGDLDLSVLDELPPGRSPIITEVLLKPKDRSWDFARSELEAGRQAYIICSRIDEGDDERKSVKKEYERMSKEIFPEFKSAMLHGKMTPRDKEKTLADFRENKIQILVATSVVEVGIDVPNATIMIVEGADRFGLAQLHQLRGRIGRGTHQSYFYAICESSAQTTLARLRALKNAKNGFELAERDLELRGPGELTGKNQWGLSDIGMEALKNIKMVEAARTEARALLERDRDLEKHPALKLAVSRMQSGYHFE